MKRVFVILLTMLLALTTSIYTEAASQQELASDYEILYTDKQVTPIQSNKAVNFYCKPAYSDNDVVVLVTSEHPFNGSLTIKTKGKKRSQVSFTSKDFINAGNHYALTAVCTFKDGTLAAGEKVTIKTKNKEKKEVLVAVVAMQKKDKLLNRSAKGTAVVDNDFLTYYGGA